MKQGVVSKKASSTDATASSEPTQSQRRLSMKKRKRLQFLKSVPKRDLKPAQLEDKQLAIAKKFIAKQSLSRGQRKRL